MESVLRENIVNIVKLYIDLVLKNIKAKEKAEEIAEVEMACIREDIKTMHHAVTCLDKANRIWNQKYLEIPEEMNDLKVRIERMIESFSALILKDNREHPEEIRENVKALDDISLVLTALDHMQKKTCGQIGVIKMEKVKLDGLFGCPFCGAVPFAWKTGFGVPKVIECGSCHTLFVKSWGIDPECLKEQWNRRVAPAQGENDDKEQI